MRRLLLALAVIALPTDAVANPFGPNNRAEWNPPRKYDYPYHGELIERSLPQKQVATECYRLGVESGGKPTFSATQHGCALRLTAKTCLIIYIDKPFGLATPKAVRRHEVGHCNGWPSDHPEE